MITTQSIVDLYRRTATRLPADVVDALADSLGKADTKVAKDVLSRIMENTEKAAKASRPICQDTGTPIFYVRYGRGQTQEGLRKVIEEATGIATADVPLRPNAVDPLTGKNVGNRPIIHFEESSGLEKPEIELMLKGGGSENVSAIYHLPDRNLGADRDMDGVSKCILDAVFRAQGKGCPPYVVGVAIGGNAEEVAHLSKKQLLRGLDDSNENEKLDAFEKDMLKRVNCLGIGPLGLGGKATALSVKAASAHRHPASFFVSVSFSCWCLRRQRL